jgi:lipopolysaccharide/colanic/teichoic acid biosynthesis glycosyltransferase
VAFAFGKRLFDLIGSSAAMCAGAPAMLAIAGLVRLRMGSPVLFRQQRPGLDGKPFVLYKFRTMRDAVDSAGNPRPDDERLTALGKLLRASSLDELPELINVLAGDMSLVGPRPLLMEYLSRYDADQARRHDVKPGITGWAQVNGRNALTWDEKFELDCWYVENRSLWLDLYILYLTVSTVLNRRGISHDGEATMPVFMGNQEEDQ